jgi:hypothetical protein
LEPLQPLTEAPMAAPAGSAGPVPGRGEPGPFPGRLPEVEAIRHRTFGAEVLWSQEVVCDISWGIRAPVRSR